MNKSLDELLKQLKSNISELSRYRHELSSELELDKLTDIHISFGDFMISLLKCRENKPQ